MSRRKLARSWPDIESETEVLRALLDPPVPLTLAVHEAALAMARDHGLAFDDALIVAAAARSGCRILYSEDMQHGRRFGG